MSFLDDSEKNIKKYTSSFKERKKSTLSLKEVTAGGVAGFTGRAGMGIDAIFAGAFHPNSGHGSQNKQLLAKQIKDRKKQRAEMEKQAAKDGVELVGVPDPIGGHFAEIGETEGIELAYEELLRFNELNKEYSDANTPSQDLEWVEVDKDYGYDDNSNLYAGDNYINQSETNWEIINRG